MWLKTTSDRCLDMTVYGALFDQNLDINGKTEIDPGVLQTLLDAIGDFVYEVDQANGK